MQAKAALNEEKALLLAQRLKASPNVLVGRKVAENKARDLQKRLEAAGLRVRLDPVLSLADKPDEEQCPACHKYVRLTPQRQCPACDVYVDKVSEEYLLRKRLEQQERRALENGLAALINQERSREQALKEQRLREQIRRELMEEFGLNERGRQRRSKRHLVAVAGGALLAAAVFTGAGYSVAQQQKPPQAASANLHASAYQLAPEQWRREDVLTNQTLAVERGLGPQPAASASEIIAANGLGDPLAAAPIAEHEASRGSSHAWRDAFRQLPEAQQAQAMAHVLEHMAQAGQTGRALQALQSQSNLPNSPHLQALQLGLQAAEIARNPDTRDMAALQQLQARINALPTPLEQARGWLAAYRALSQGQPAFFEQNTAFANEAQTRLDQAGGLQTAPLQAQLEQARAEALQNHIAWLAAQGRWNEAQKRYDQLREAANQAEAAQASPAVQAALLAQHALAARKLGLLKEETALMHRLPALLTQAMQTDAAQLTAALAALRPWARAGNWEMSRPMQQTLRAVADHASHMPPPIKADIQAQLALLNHATGDRQHGAEMEKQFRQTAATLRQGQPASAAEARYLVESGLVFADRARRDDALGLAETWLRSVGLVVFR